MQWNIMITLLIATAQISARNGKWFFKKNTVIQFVSEKQVTPSCVVLEESLKPCRHLRQIEPSPTLQLPKILMTMHPMGSAVPTDSLRTSKEEHPKVLSWGSYLGLGEVTVTRTITQRAFAPPVTFSVRGCRPTRLPFDLPLCSASPIPTTSQLMPSRAVHYAEE